MKLSPLLISILLGIAAAILFIPFLGAVHLFDWDEVNFAECAREMIKTHDYSTAQINFFPFWEKPPLFIWMQVLSMKVFGINEFAARFPNALCGIVTVVLVFNLGRKLYDNRFGLLWALAFAGSLLPHFYFKSGIIDPWFNLFIFLGIYHLARYTNDYTYASSSRFFNRSVFLSSLFIALAILTKGPVAGACIRTLLYYLPHHETRSDHEMETFYSCLYHHSRYWRGMVPDPGIGRPDQHHYGISSLSDPFVQHRRC